MWNKQEFEKNDLLKDYYREISDGMTPSPELVKKVKGGTTVKLLAKSVHVKRFAKAAACYVIGIGLFLGAIALISGLWDRSESLATQHTTLMTAQTTAPSNPEPAPDILLSSLYEGKTVTEIEVWHPFYMNAMYTISDEDMVNAVLSELAVTNASASNHYRYFQQDLFIKLKFADGGLGEFEFAYESGEVNYSVRDANGYPNVKGYQVSDAALEKLKAVVNAQIQLAIPTQKYPAPEEYLGGEIAEATLRYRYKYGGDNRVLNDVQITAIVEGLKTILTGLPLSTEPVLTDAEYYDVELIDRNGDQVRIRLYYNTGELIVKWNSKNALAGAYNFKIPVVNAREYAFWLDRYYKGESSVEFPSIDNSSTTVPVPETDDPIIIKPCEHDYVLTQGTPSCTKTVTLQYTCSKCQRSYSEKISATGHSLEKGYCTACNFVDITTLTGDEIMNLIKESGCPEDSLVYGFDSEVGDDELAKIQDFLVNSDAKYAFSVINNMTFYSPYEVDPFTILYHFHPTESRTQAEYEEYYKYHNITTDEEKEWVNLEYKMTTKEISNYLKTYFGIEFTKQMKEDLKKEATYLKKFDAYYLGATDFAGNPPFSVYKAYQTADGTILAIPSECSPEQINERTSFYWAVILTPYKGSYRIAMSVNLYSLH